MKTNKLRVFLISAMLMLLLLFFTNPNESDYLKSISSNYGELHHGLSLDESDLLKLGNGKRASFVFFSTYKYRYGTISVSYFGILSKVYFTGSSWDMKESEEEKEILTQLTFLENSYKYF